MTRRSWLMMGGAAAVWGASYMFIKVALEDFSEGTIVCLRTALGAAVLLALAHALGRAGTAARALAPGRGDRLWCRSSSRSCSSPSARTTSTPSWPASSSPPRRSSPRCSRWPSTTTSARRAGPRSASSSACSGSCCSSALDLSGSSDQVVGGLMVLLASLGYAAGALLLKHKLPGAPPVGVAGGQMAVAALVTLPLCLASLPDHAPSFEAVGALVLLGDGGHRHRLPVVLHADRGASARRARRSSRTSRRASASSTASSCSASRSARRRSAGSR